MFYPTTEYAYVDENGQNVEPSNFVQHVYADNNDQTTTQMVLDGNSYYNNQSQQQQQTQYRPVAISGSQPL